MRHVLRGMTLFAVAPVIACGQSEIGGDLVERESALSSTNARILGFETPVADWSVINGGSGTITASTIRSQGNFSLAIDARNYVPIQSVPMSSLGADVTPTVSYDVMLPSPQPNPFWFGATQLFVSIPSLGINNAFIGQVELTGFPLNEFRTVTYTLPANILNALRGTYTDLRFTIVLNVPFNATGLYRVDNFQATPAAPPVTITRIGTDTFTNPTSQHATQVEPDSFSFGSTIVAAAQTGRFVNGGASDIAFATSQDGGATWITGNTPGITIFAGGPFARVSDPAVAFDSRHNVWIISGLGITEPTPGTTLGAAVTASRSTDGGLTWQNAVTVAAATGSSDFDKNWIACDNTATSPFFGNCYTEWDDAGNGQIILMSTSTDGGLSWGPPLATAGSATGVGGQPIVQPNGTVVVVIPSGLFGGNMLAFRSTNGGASWNAPVVIAPVTFHREDLSADLRSEALPSVEIDGAGRIYAAWPDCSFRPGCPANDIVMSTSTDGMTWTPVVRIPIDAATSTVDHFIPGLGVDTGTSGASAHLGLTYYFFPNTSCTAATCELNVGFISSADGGATWGAPRTLAGPMNLSWLADTTLGRMVGDYVSTSFSGGTAHSFFIVATPPVGGVFDEAMFTAANSVPTLAATAALAAEPAAPGLAASRATAAPATSTARLR